MHVTVASRLGHVADVRDALRRQPTCNGARSSVTRTEPARTVGSATTTTRARIGLPNWTVALSKRRVRRRAEAAATARRRRRRAARSREHDRASSPRPPSAPAFLRPAEERRVDRAGVARPDLDRTQSDRVAARRPALRSAARARFAPRSACAGSGGRDRPRGSATGTPTPRDVGPAPLPDRVLDHDWHDVPAVADRVQPASAGTGARKSRTTKTNVPPGTSVRCCARNASARSDRVLRRVEGRARRRARRRATAGRAARAAATRPRRRRSRAPRCPRGRRRRSPRSRSPPPAARPASRATAAAAGRGPSPGRRSSTIVTRGASSAARSRTTNSSPPRAAESRAEANQSIVETGSPGSYGRDADHLACRGRGGGSADRRTVGRVSRRRGTSGNVRRSRADMRSTVPVGRGRRRELEAARANPPERLLAAERARLGEEGSRQEQPVSEHRAGRAARRPPGRRGRGRAGAPTRARCARASRLPRTDAPIATPSTVAGRPHEVDGPAQDQLVDVDRPRRRAAAARISSHVIDRAERRRADGRGAARRRSRPPRPRSGSRARSGARTGRAAPRAAGTCPPARSGSPSRSRRTARAAAASTPSTVTWRSAIASSSADCVRGIARLISSTRTTFAKTGPGRNSNSRVFWLKIERPVTSVGWRSGVHWMRENVAPSIDCASARARIVFAVPGTSSSSTWPPEMKAATTSAISSGLPTTTRSMFASSRSPPPRLRHSPQPGVDASFRPRWEKVSGRPLLGQLSGIDRVGGELQETGGPATV